jgi:hypothetical protein
MGTALEGLAGDIAAEDGLIWKIWTENRHEKRAGGIYLYCDRPYARRVRCFFTRIPLQPRGAKPQSVRNHADG